LWNLEYIYLRNSWQWIIYGYKKLKSEFLVNVKANWYLVAATCLIIPQVSKKKPLDSSLAVLPPPSSLRSFEPVDVIEILQVNQVNLSTTKCIFKRKGGMGGGGNGRGTMVGGIDRFYRRFTESQKMHRIWRWTVFSIQMPAHHNLIYEFHVPWRWWIGTFSSKATNFCFSFCLDLSYLLSIWYFHRNLSINFDSLFIADYMRFFPILGWENQTRFGYRVSSGIFNGISWNNLDNLAYILTPL